MVEKILAEFQEHIKKISLLIINIRRIEKYHAMSALNDLKSQARYQQDKSLIPYGQKIYSQSDEDGIIREIFNRIGVTNKVFVEIGSGDGLENNTLALLFDGWRGLWIDGNPQNVEKIKNGYQRTLSSQRLSVLQALVSRENVNDLISSKIDEKEIDLLSIDIDGNDYHVFNAIDCLKPRVLVIEYNAKFPPPIQYIRKYEHDFKWDKDDDFGASLKSFEIELSKQGFCLVGCTLQGTNAFFVREDLVGDKFLEPFTAENHYEPARYFLTQDIVYAGHKPSYRTLENMQNFDQESDA